MSVAALDILLGWVGVGGEGGGGFWWFCLHRQVIIK
jgi:hypothetical protein